MLLDYSCAAPKQAVGLTYPEPDFSPEVQSLSVPLYGELFRRSPTGAGTRFPSESCHPRALDYFPQEMLCASCRISQAVYVAQLNIRDEIITATGISQILCHSHSNRFFTFIVMVAPIKVKFVDRSLRAQHISSDKPFVTACDYLLRAYSSNWV